MSFTRKIENFTCAHCGTNVIGNGYTNHCPLCLWSKHVDIEPGDRRANCGGLMKPFAINLKNGQYIISFRCEKCGLERNNKTVAEDNFEMILKLAENDRQ